MLAWWKDIAIKEDMSRALLQEGVCSISMTQKRAVEWLEAILEELEYGGRCERRCRQKPDHVGHVMELALYSKNKGIALKGFTQRRNLNQNNLRSPFWPQNGLEEDMGTSLKDGIIQGKHKGLKQDKWKREEKDRMNLSTGISWQDGHHIPKPRRLEVTKFVFIGTLISKS